MSTLRTLSKFKGKLQGGGARPNLFEVRLDNLPDAAKDVTPVVTWGPTQGQEDFAILCKTVTFLLPPLHQSIFLSSRTLKVAGDRTIENWTVTIINDENFYIRTAMEAWMNRYCQVG